MASHWRDDPKYDDMIVFNCRGGNERAIADAVSDYLTFGNGRGKFGSFGSQHGGLSVWMTNRTDLDDVEGLIDFMQSNGAYTTEYDIKKIRRRFGVSASRGVRKRSIKASTSYVRDEFQRFIGDIEADIQDNERALSGCARLKGSFMADGDGAIFEITPSCYGVLADDIDTLCIEYNKKTGEYTAYCAGNDDVVAIGYSFNDIRFDCYNWLKETLIQMYENIDDEFVY